MQFTLSPKPSDDPCDAVGVAPDVVRVVPSDDELSDLMHHVARYRSDSQTQAAADLKPDSTTPAVEATFRPVTANEVRGSEDRRSIAALTARAGIALLLGACISLAAVAWRSYGEAAKRTIAALTTQFVVASSQPEKPALAVQADAPAVQEVAASSAPRPPASPAQTAPNAVAPSTDPSPDSAQFLQSVARDLAGLRREVGELKASMEQLKASQQQMLSDVARFSEQNQRSAISAPPPRPVAPQTRKQVRSVSAPHAAALSPMLPQATAPSYAPPQPESQSPAPAEHPADAELSPVRRPPMPVR